MADISKEDLRKEIAAILKDADLASTSAKKVRQELEEKLDVKLQSRKKEIDDLVMKFVSAKKTAGGKKKGKKDESDEEGGVDEEEEEEEEDEEEEDDDEEDSEADKKKKRGSTGKKPAAKKAKKSSDDSASEGSDGESEEEYSPKKAKPAKTRKLPPKKKKGSESDSDEDWGKKKGGAKPGAKRGGGGYTKALQLSPELAAVVGADTMARHEVVKKIWSIIKEKNMYDPKNKQFAICDDALMKVIGTKRFRTFGMMKYLKNHFIS